MLNQWSIDPALVIKYYEQAGFPKITRWQKCKLYIYCYLKDIKHWIINYR